MDLFKVKPPSSPKVQFHYELIEGFFGDKKEQIEHQVEQKVAIIHEDFNYFFLEF